MMYKPSKQSIILLYPGFIIAILASFYYAIYYDIGFDLYDGGFFFYAIQRFLAGDIPYVDFEPGYGPLWFYPTVLICNIFGDNLNTIRIFLFCISIITGILSFYLIRTIAKNNNIAYIASFLIVIFHTQIDRVWIPFCVCLSVLIFIRYDVKKASRFVVSGFGTGIIFLIRPECGWMAASLLCLLIFASALHEKRTPKLCFVIRNLCLTLFGMGLSYVPFIVYAAHHGFLDAFVKQQVQFGLFCANIVLSTFFGDSGSVAAQSTSLLGKISPVQLMQEAANLIKGVSTHNSLLLLVRGASAYGSLFFLIAAGIGAFLLPRASKHGDAPYIHLWHTGVIIVSLLPSFFAFFCFRPDMTHFYQLLPSMILLFSVLTGKWLQYRCNKERKRFHSILLVIICLSGIIFLTASVVPRLSGTLIPNPLSIAYAEHRLEIPSTTSVRLAHEDFKRISGLLEHLELYTEPDGAVAVYPYMPGLFALSRRANFSYLHYVDDMRLKVEPDWCDKEIVRFKARPPQAVIISDWAINGTEHSRFTNWANPLYRYILDNYHLVWEDHEYKMFAHKKTPNVLLEGK